MRRDLFWGRTLGLALALWLLTRIEQSERGMAWMSAGLCAAVLAAFVHALLDFTLLTPGGLALFVAAIGIANTMVMAVIAPNCCSGMIEENRSTPKPAAVVRAAPASAAHQQTSLG